MLKSGRRPAACQVEPEVSSLRSTRTTSRPALLGQVVERRDADHAAADHHHPAVVLIDPSAVLVAPVPGAPPHWPIGIWIGVAYGPGHDQDATPGSRPAAAEQASRRRARRRRRGRGAAAPSRLRAEDIVDPFFDERPGRGALLLSSFAFLLPPWPSPTDKSAAGFGRGGTRLSPIRNEGVWTRRRPRGGWHERGGAGSRGAGSRGAGRAARTRGAAGGASAARPASRFPTSRATCP